MIIQAQAGRGCRGVLFSCVRALRFSLGRGSGRGPRRSCPSPEIFAAVVASGGLLPRAFGSPWLRWELGARSPTGGAGPAPGGAGAVQGRRCALDALGAYRCACPTAAASAALNPDAPYGRRRVCGWERGGWARWACWCENGALQV